MREHRALPPAILASLLVHVMLFAAARVAPAADAPPAPPPLQDPVDVWAGTTAELPGAGERMYEVEVADRAASGEASMRAPEPTKPAPESARPAAHAPRPQPEVPRPDAEDPYADPPRPSPSTTARPSVATARPGRVAPAASATPAAPAARAAPSSAEARAPGEPGHGQGARGARGSFGAEGSGSVRSLGRAFTRAIPPACQADAGWSALPPGSAGTARVVIEIDAEGHVAGWTPEKGSVAPHFEGLMRRTLALLRSGTFAVQGTTVSAGVQVIEISATVGEAAAAPESGGAIDLAWRFEEGRGTASFSQAGGRRVEITLRVVRAQVAGSGLPD